MGTIVTGTMQAFGEYMSGHAQAQAANYNAAVSIQNAQNEKRNATIAAESGSQQAGTQSLETRATIGAEKANQGASGMNVNTGSSLDTQVSTHETGTLDAMTVRTNAAREAYGYQTRAANAEAQAEMDRYNAKNAELGGIIKGSTTILNTGQDAAHKFAKLQAAGGLG